MPVFTDHGSPPSCPRAAAAALHPPTEARIWRRRRLSARPRLCRGTSDEHRNFCPARARPELEPCQEEPGSPHASPVPRRRRNAGCGNDSGRAGVRAARPLRSGSGRLERADPAVRLATASAASPRWPARGRARRSGTGSRGAGLGFRRRTRVERKAITAARNHGDNQLNGNSSRPARAQYTSTRRDAR